METDKRQRQKTETAKITFFWNVAGYTLKDKIRSRKLETK
jgi:hypothetical protein